MLDPKKDKEDQIKKDVENLEQSIKDAQKEIDELQKSCIHPKESVKIKNISPEGVSDLRNVCGICNHIMGYPNKEDMEIWTGSVSLADRDNKSL